MKRIFAVIVLLAALLVQASASAEQEAPTQESFTEYALALMVKAQPRTNVAWANTYETTAAAIAKVASANPLYPGTEGIKRTISVMVAVAFFESHFDPKAEGDCPDKDSNGMCVKGSVPRSFCAFQVDKSNFPFLGVTKDEILGDVEVCARSGLRMMKESFRLCKGWKPDELLNQYATGGSVCVRPRRDEGEHRMRKAQWLYRWKQGEDKKQASSN